MQSQIKTETASPDATPTDPLQIAFASRDADVMHLVRVALDTGRARLAFQPVVLATDVKKVAFYEGLIRLMDESGRVIPAAHFMSHVEETVLGRRIDVLALQLAWKMLRTNTGLRLSVNLSARSLADWRWRQTLEAGLAEPGRLGERLIFEINEQSAMMLHDGVMRFMEDMQPRGVSFALDGFGGGMISFRHLKDFFFDMVKIDKSFTRKLAEDPDNQILVEALTNVSQQFGMFTVAEGVEHTADSRFLQSIGVDCMQGYLFGAPRFGLD